MSHELVPIRKLMVSASVIVAVNRTLPLPKG